MYDTLDELQPWCAQQLVFPSVKEWISDSQRCEDSEHFKGYLLMAVDGTVVPVHDTAEIIAHRKSYNSKHGETAHSFFILCTMRGRIVYVSDVGPGSTHDATQWAESGVIGKLRAAYGAAGEARVGRRAYRMGVCGDKAYPNIELPEGWHLIITKSGQADASKSARTKNVSFNPAIAVLRSVVERVFARMKQWKILVSGTSFISNPVYAELVVTFIAALTNWITLREDVSM
jgi:hypothetical protein